MKTEGLELSYHYAASDETDFSPTLVALEAQLGGERWPWGMRGASIDLVTAFEVVVGVAAAYVLKPIVTEYAKGLFAADKVKKLGEEHRKVVTDAIGTLWHSIQRLPAALKESVGRLVTVVEPKHAIVLMFHVDGCSCAFVLNPSGDHHGMFEALPDGIVDFLLLCASGVLPTDADMVQFWYDRGTCRWRFVFMPTFKKRFVDRVLDLESNQIFFLTSREDFISRFSVSREDEWKFIFDPFEKQ
jgi:hypothetical protein